MTLAHAFACRGVVVERELAGGHRNRVFLARKDSRRVVVKATRHHEASLQWLVPVLGIACECGLAPPNLIPDDQGRLSTAGLTLEHFVEGKPARKRDLHGLAPRLKAFHARLLRYPERPGQNARRAHQSGLSVGVRRAFGRSVARGIDHVQSVIHGDVTTPNCFLGAGGPSLMDWDETRRDAVVLELPLVGATAAVRRERLVSEIRLGWGDEPDYARRLLKRLVAQAGTKAGV